MNLTVAQKRVIIDALNYQAYEIERILLNTNASEERWQRVSDLYALAVEIELSIIDPNYV